MNNDNFQNAGYQQLSGTYGMFSFPTIREIFPQEPLFRRSDYRKSGLLEAAKDRQNGQKQSDFRGAFQSVRLMNFLWSS